MIEQHRAKHVVGAIHFEVDLVESALGGVSEPSVHDSGDLIGPHVRHEHRVEADAMCRVGHDDGRCGSAIFVEPEQLREIVS